MSEFIDWLRRQLDEDEVLAIAVSQTREPGTPTGEHWRWECHECDTEIIPNVGIDEYLTCPNCGSWGGSLRSIEQYPTSSVGLLPAFITSGDEALTVVGAYLLRCDPARILREVAAKRQLIHRYEIADDAAEVADGTVLAGGAKLRRATFMDALRSLAEVYRDRPGWREEWREATG